MKALSLWKLSLFLFAFSEITTWTYAQNQKSIKVGIIAPMTGKHSHFGGPLVDGIKFALAYSHDVPLMRTGHGGTHHLIIEGEWEIPIELIYRDSVENNSESIVKDLSQNRGVHLIIGPCRSSLVQPILQNLELDTAILSPYATRTDLTDPDKINADATGRRFENKKWFFRAVSPDRQRASALADWMVEEHTGDGIIAIVYDQDDAYGQGLEEDVSAVLNQKRRQKISIGYASLETGEGIIGELSKYKQIDAIAVLGFSPDVSRIIKQMKQSTLSQIRIYTVDPSIRPPNSEREGLFYGREFDGVRSMSNQYLSPEADVESQDFVKAYKNYFRDTHQSEYQGKGLGNAVAFGYDSALLAFSAIRQAVLEAGQQEWDSLSLDEQRQGIRLSLEQVDVKGRVMSSSIFDKNHDLTVKTRRYVQKANELHVYNPALKRSRFRQWIGGMGLMVIGGLIGGWMRVLIALLRDQQGASLREGFVFFQSKLFSLIFSMLTAGMVYLMWERMPFIQEIYPKLIENLSLHNAQDIVIIGWLTGLAPFSVTDFIDRYREKSSS